MPLFTAYAAFEVSTNRTSRFYLSNILLDLIPTEKLMKLAVCAFMLCLFPIKKEARSWEEIADVNHGQ